MKIFKILILIPIFIFMFSCNREDIIKKDAYDYDPIEIKYLIRSSVTGYIADENNIPIANAEIKFGDKNLFTNEEGYFQIKNDLLNKEGEIMEIYSQNHFTQYAVVQPELNKITQINIIQQKRSNAKTIDSKIDNQEQFYNSKIICNIPKNIFSKTDKTDYNGQVKIYVKSPFLDQNNQYQNPSMGIPRSNTGISMDSTETVVLPIFSTLVKFETSNEEPLDIKQKIDIKTFLDFSTFNDNDHLYLWKFDNNSGKWIAKSQVSYDFTDNSLSFEIKDQGYFIIAQYNIPIVSIEGEVTYDDGTPARLVPVEIINKNNNSTLTGMIFTDCCGYYYCYVEQNSDIVLRFIDCNNTAFEIPLGQISSSSINNIILPYNFNNSFTINIENIFNDNNDVVNNGYVEITDYDLFSTYIPVLPDSTGIVLNIHTCDPVLVLYDLDNLPDVKKSNEIYLSQVPNFNSYDYPANDIDDDYIYATIDNNESIFDSHPWISKEDQGYVLSNSDLNCQLVIYFYKDYNTNDYLGQISYFKFDDNAQIENYISSETDPVVFDITENQESITAYYSDSIFYDNDIKLIEGYFKFKKY